MSLPGIVRGKKRPPRMVVYGPPKIGKSMLGADAPAPVFVTTEEGVDNLPVDQYPRAESWTALLSNIKSVAQEDHEYKTLVLDTLNGGAELAAAHVCATQFRSNWGPGGFQSFGQGWAATSEEMRVLLPMLDVCRARGMTVLLLAHAGIVNVKNPVDGDYQKFTPDLDKRVWARISAWADVILRAEYEVSIVEDKQGKRQAISDSRRQLICQGSAVEDAGTRVGYSLPARLPLAWSAIAEHIGRDNGAADKVRGIFVELAPERASKVLAYLGIKSIDEIENADSAKINVVINKESQHA